MTDIVARHSQAENKVELGGARYEVHEDHHVGVWQEWAVDVCDLPVPGTTGDHLRQLAVHTKAVTPLSRHDFGGKPGLDDDLGQRQMGSDGV
ncbi:hypothetical protein [Amycolatopsis sp. lyj-108]|uniref:hypothetical protein n=1 Tax=Amycolatopsis sp. lyj-108 TaxID=2789286 RepID=UPI00397B905E